MTSVNETLQRLGLAVLETVQESGQMGAPSGHLYAALMVHGATLSHYVECSIMNSAFGQAWLRLGFVAEAMLVDST